MQHSKRLDLSIKSGFRGTNSTSKRAALIEPLESRCLLSVASPTLAQGPNLIANPLATAIPLAGNIPAGNSSPVGYTPAQIRSAYGIASIKFKGTIVGDGSGQTIAIINAYDNPKLVNSSSSGFSSSDLHKFDVQFGIADPPSFIKVNQNGGTQYPTTNPSWANEAALDVEWTHAIAPKAKILLVEANSDGLNDLISSAVEYARLQPNVSVITMSFAAGEASGETFYDSYLSTPSSHTGETFVAASGDSGSVGGYPAFSPMVMSVGSTTLNLSGNSYVKETGRSNSGGGISQFESKPAFQVNVTQSSTFRTSPDVAFDGDSATGVAVYDSFNGGSSPWYKVGGTSFSAPVWAGLIAITNQGRAASSLASLDGATQTLPRLYELSGSDFHDITSGNNGFSAGAGYDLVTGLGTPKANTLVPDLAGGGSISGTVFSDVNGNGAINSGEPGLNHWGVFIDFNNDGAFNKNDIRVFSDSSGHFTFGDLPGGVTYHLRQGAVAGWKRTTPTSFPLNVTVAAGQVVTNKNIGNQQQTGTISGHMFDDLNGNGTQQSNEPALSGWGCFIDADANGSFNSGDVRAFSDSNGNYSFPNLNIGGTYHILQATPSGWQRTVPTSLPYYVSLTTGGQVITGINFANKPLTGAVAGTISGTVFNDHNANGSRDSDDSGLFGWGVFLDSNNNGIFDGTDTRVFSDANGNYSMANLAAGTYHINEGVPTGWQRTLPSLAGYTLTLAAGQVVTGKNIGNHQV